MLMRSQIADRRIGPFVNESTNPRLKRCVAGSTVFKRNLATSPIFARALSGTDVVRRNHLATPTGKILSNGEWRVRYGATQEYRTDSPPPGVTGYRRATNASVGLGWDFYANSQTGTPGSTVTLGPRVRTDQLVTVHAWLRASDATEVRLRNRIATDVDTWAIGTRLLDTHDIEADEWALLSWTMTAEADGYMAFLLEAVDLDPAGYLDGAVCIVVGASPGYFDGDTVDALGFAYEWEGTEGESTSVIKTATVEVRRNLFPTPDGSTSWQNWVSSSLASSEVLAETSLSLRRRVTAIDDIPDGNAFAGGFTSTNNVATTPGEVLTISVSARPTVGCTIRLRILWLDATGSVLSVQDGFAVPLTPGIVGKLTAVAVTAPASAAFVTVRLANGGPTTAAGTVIDYGDILIERTSVVQPFFSGFVTPDEDFMPAWVGTPNASESVLLGTRIIGSAGFDMTKRAWFYSWVTASARVIPLGTDNYADTFYGIPHVESIEEGKTYTVVLDIEIKAPQTGLLDPRARSVAIRIGSTNYVSEQAPNVAGIHTVRLTFTRGVGEGVVWFRAYMGTATGGGDMWIRGMALVEGGAYSGPIFHGDTDPDDTGIVYEWEGTAHDSASVMKVDQWEIRRNLAKNSSFLNPPSSLSSSGGTVDVSAEHVHGSCPSSWKVEKTSSSTHIFGRLDSNSTSGDTGVVPSGTTRYMGVWIYAEQDTVINAPRRGTSGYTSNVRSLTSGWNFVVVSYTGDGVSTVGWDVGFEANNGVIGDIIHISALLVQDGIAPTGDASEWFDGYYSPDGDLSAAWTGTPDASASVLYGANVEGCSYNQFSTPYRSFELGGVNFLMRGDAGQPLSMLNKYPVENRLYTSLMTVTSLDADTEVECRVGGSTLGPGSSIDLSEGVPTAIVQNVTAGAGNGNGLYIRTPDLTPGMRVNVRDWVLTDGIYNGPYFDGDDDRVIWRGTPHASESVGYPALV